MQVEDLPERAGVEADNEQQGPFISAKIAFPSFSMAEDMARKESNGWEDLEDFDWHSIGENLPKWVPLPSEKLEVAIQQCQIKLSNSKPLRSCLVIPLDCFCFIDFNTLALVIHFCQINLSIHIT